MAEGISNIYLISEGQGKCRSTTTGTLILATKIECEDILPIFQEFILVHIVVIKSIDLGYSNIVRSHRILSLFVRADADLKTY